MRIQFSIRMMLLAMTSIAILLWFFTPVASINPALCVYIQPGMSVEQAQEIVGVPPGYYDGVNFISTAALHDKGYRPTWAGLRGEIVIELDENRRMTQATFYPGKVVEWSMAKPMGTIHTNQIFEPIVAFKSCAAVGPYCCPGRRVGLPYHQGRRKKQDCLIRAHRASGGTNSGDRGRFRCIYGRDVAYDPFTDQPNLGCRDWYRCGVPSRSIRKPADTDGQNGLRYRLG